MAHTAEFKDISSNDAKYLLDELRAQLGEETFRQLALGPGAQTGADAEII
jgi:hypothetical protein